MEGSYWLRFGVIVAMLFGCLYVLAPTFLVETEVDADSFASSTSVEREPPTDAWFVTDGDVDDADVEAVTARLRAAGAKLESVTRTDERLVVSVMAGVDKETVVPLVTSSGAAIHGPDAVGIDPAALAEADDVTAAIASAIASAGAPPASSKPLAGVTAKAELGDAAVRLTLSGSVPETLDVAVVVLDGAVVGHVMGPVKADEPMLYVPRAGAVDAKTVGAILAHPFPSALSREEIVETAAPEKVEAVEEEVEEALTWWEPLLPDTKLNLGLDLQGGIDLTLQVDLEAAVFGQVQRDHNEVRDKIAKDKVDIKLTRERSRPAMRVYEDDFAKAQTFMGESLPDYDYLESFSDDDGAYHVWQISEERDEEIRSGAVEQVLETLRKRVDSTGVKEPSIVKMGGGRINIQLPGVTGSQQATDAIGTQAVLQFRLVDETTDQNDVARNVGLAEKAMPKEQFEDDDLLNDWLRSNDLLPADMIVKWMYEEVAPDVYERRTPMQLKERVELTGGDVNDAMVSMDQNREPNVILSFKARGKNRFCEITTENVNKRFAIILDEEIRSAPNINEPICGGSASIRMGASMDAMEDANTLALVLRTGSLTAPVDTGEIREIGPSLGADAIDSGVRGALIGGAFILLVMGIWYGRPGMIANIALVLNVMLVFALLAMFGATLTLPGIAGVALTIGMAVDANIIVYERIREELRLGVNARKAVDTGYEKAVVAVLDANITTAIAGVVLYSYGTGPIKGFAVTLLIGIFTTLVTALFVTRTFMEMLTRNSNVRLRI